MSPKYLAGMAAKFAKSPEEQLKVGKFLLACGDYKAAAKTVEEAASAGAGADAETLALLLPSE